MRKTYLYAQHGTSSFDSELLKNLHGECLTVNRGARYINISLQHSLKGNNHRYPTRYREEVLTCPWGDGKPKVQRCLSIGSVIEYE